MAISDILTQVTAIVTAAVGWIGQFVDSITDNPILLMFVIFGFIDFPVDRRSNPAVV